jgi:hypothetical protein
MGPLETTIPKRSVSRTLRIKSLGDEELRNELFKTGEFFPYFHVLPQDEREPALMRRNFIIVHYKPRVMKINALALHVKK